MAALRVFTGLASQLQVPPADGLAEQVRAASCDYGIKRWRLHLTPEQIESVAYGFWLHRLTGSAAEANRFSRVRRHLPPADQRGRQTGGHRGTDGILIPDLRRRAAPDPRRRRRVRTVAATPCTSHAVPLRLRPPPPQGAAGRPAAHPEGDRMRRRSDAHTYPVTGGAGSVASSAVAAPRDDVDDATVVVAEGRGVGAVVPDVVAAVLVDVAEGVAADAGVDTDGGAAVQAVVAEGVGGPSGAGWVACQASQISARSLPRGGTSMSCSRAQARTSATSGAGVADRSRRVARTSARGGIGGRFSGVVGVKPRRSRVRRRLWCMRSRRGTSASR
ncbi:DUF6417 family protein [Streptomyces kaempferi]